MSSEIKVPFFKKGKARAKPTTSRVRSASPENGASTSTNQGPAKSQVVLPSKKASSNLLSAGTKRKRTEGADDEDEDRDGPDMKWSAEDSHVNAAQQILAGDEIEELMAKRRRDENDKIGYDSDEVDDDGKYHGQSKYQKHLKKSKDVPKAMRVGPQRASGSTIRTVTITDYQPDVCKDYKETGFCGFGDTCKFLHDRGTYLAGWQLDKMAENAKNQNSDGETTDDDSDEEDIPFACLICRKPYTDPIVTRCNHYFCSACAIKRFAKTPRCLACGTPTGGMFNRADKIIAKTEKKRKDKDDRRAAREAERGGDDAEASGGVQIEGLGGGSNGGSGDDDSDEDD